MLLSTLLDDALIVGTPTWNTGADIERSGTGWDELYYNELQDAGNLHSSDFKGKKVAVFGLGDSEGYGDNYADASGELHDVFEKLGCRMMGYTSQDGYFHSASKAIRGNLFCGLMNDMVNQEDMAEERVEKWVEQLISEGILESAGVESSNSESVTTPVVSIKEDLSSIEVEQKVLEDNSLLLEEEIVVSSVETTIEKNDGESFTPHYNPKTRITMWTSPDGRKSYFTKSPPKMA